MYEIRNHIEWYEWSYMVSNLWNIKSKNGLLKLWIRKNWYTQICLKNKWNKKTFYVHRIVAKSFIKNPLLKQQVNHIDSIKTNNRIDNLERVTPYENSLHSKNSNKPNKLEKRVWQYDKQWNMIAIRKSVTQAQKVLWVSHIREACLWKNYYKKGDLSPFSGGCNHLFCPGFPGRSGEWQRELHCYAVWETARNDISFFSPQPSAFSLFQTPVNLKDP